MAFLPSGMMPQEVLSVQSFFINKTESGSQIDVRLAALDNGGFAAVWSDSGNDGS